MEKKYRSDFKANGYLSYFFKEYAEGFNLSKDLDIDTMNVLVWLAWKENNFPAFKFFMIDFGLILATRRHASALWQNRIGHFFLKYGDIKNAIVHFTIGVEKYPDEEFIQLIHAGLGIANHRIGNLKLANEYYLKSSKSVKEPKSKELHGYLLQLKSLIENDRKQETKYF